eukprot:4435191-Prymnesium_polylepis.1
MNVPCDCVVVWLQQERTRGQLGRACVGLTLGLGDLVRCWGYWRAASLRFANGISAAPRPQAEALAANPQAEALAASRLRARTLRPQLCGRGRA